MYIYMYVYVMYIYSISTVSASESLSSYILSCIHWDDARKPGEAGRSSGGQLPCVGSSVIYTEAAVLPCQRARAALALAVDIQAQGGLCLPVQAVAVCL